MQLFVAHDVIDADLCARIRNAMSVGFADSGEVLGSDMRVEEDVRKVLSIEVAPEILELVESRFDAAASLVERFFQVAAEAREGTSLLRYLEGGFYRAHRDRGESTAWPDAARRRVALVLFLNSSRLAIATGAFDGGALRLYPDDLSEPPVDVAPKQGTLVAFPATTLHEVLPVLNGVRDTAVDWLY